MRNIQRLLQVFSVSIQLNDHKSTELSLKVGPDGKIEGGQKGLLTSSNFSPLKKCSEQSDIQLCGTIRVLDGLSNETFIYKRAKETPEFLSCNDDISLIGDGIRCSCASNVTIYIDLKDAVRDLEISRGYICFVAASNHPCYYNKRLSAVVKGKQGSATVFYSIFKYAIQATVGVKLLVKSDNIGRTNSSVNGCICVRYGGHDYQLEFQKRHYRTVLFKESSSNGFPLEGNETVIPLSIPMVAVPMNTSLIIEADLHVMCSGSEIATICADREFDESDSSDSDELDTPNNTTIKGNNAELEVTVTWSSYY